MRIVPDGDSVEISGQSGDSRELMAIATRLMPEWLILFAEKNADYGSGTAFELGIRGQYSDIYRKVVKLRRAMWDGEELKFEGIDEVIKDLISHLFLTLHMLEIKEDVDRAYSFSDESSDVFVDRFIAELGGPEQTLRVSALLSETLSSKVTERCRQLAEEAAPRTIHSDPENYDVRNVPTMAEYQRAQLADQVRKNRMIVSEEQQELLAARLRKGADARAVLGDLQNMKIEFHGNVASDDLKKLLGRSAANRMAGEEFGSADAAQHGAGAGPAEDCEAAYEPSEGRYEAEAKVGPARVVAETVNGETRYYHEAFPGSDREPLALVPKALIGRLQKNHYVAGKEHEAELNELARWTE